VLTHSLTAASATTGLLVQLSGLWPSDDDINQQFDVGGDQPSTVRADYNTGSMNINHRGRATQSLTKAMTISTQLSQCAGQGAEFPPLFRRLQLKMVQICRATLTNGEQPSGANPLQQD
jgi:hypothetical protein